MAAIATLLAGRTLAADFLIHDGDCVVFLGDSITHQRLYTTYIEAAYTLDPASRLDALLSQCGLGGDTSWLRQRFHSG